jgi:hypothetical protein
MPPKLHQQVLEWVPDLAALGRGHPALQELQRMPPSLRDSVLSQLEQAWAGEGDTSATAVAEQHSAAGGASGPHQDQQLPRAVTAGSQLRDTQVGARQGAAAYNNWSTIDRSARHLACPMAFA